MVYCTAQDTVIQFSASLNLTTSSLSVWIKISWATIWYSLMKHWQTLPKFASMATNNCLRSRQDMKDNRNALRSHCQPRLEAIVLWAFEGNLGSVCWNNYTVKKLYSRLEFSRRALKCHSLSEMLWKLPLPGASYHNLAKSLSISNHLYL